MKIENIIEKLSDIREDYIHSILNEKLFICDIESFLREMDEVLEKLIDRLEDEIEAETSK